MKNQELWEEAAAFHGCECPALAIGFRAVTYVMEQFGLSCTGQHPIVCIAESFSCAIDAIQAIFRCTLGNGMLQIQNQHRIAFRFCHTRLQRSILLVLRPSALPNPATVEDVLKLPIHQLFNISTFSEVPVSSPNCFLSSCCPVRRPGEAQQRDIPRPPDKKQSLYRRGYDRDW